MPFKKRRTKKLDNPFADYEKMVEDQTVKVYLDKTKDLHNGFDNGAVMKMLIKNMYVTEMVKILNVGASSIYIWLRVLKKQYGLPKDATRAQLVEILKEEYEKEVSNG